MKLSPQLFLYPLLICLLTTCHKFPNPYVHGTITWMVNNETFQGKSLVSAFRTHSDSLLEISGIQDNDNNLEMRLQMITTPGVYIAGRNIWPEQEVQLMYSGQMYYANYFYNKVTIHVTEITKDHITGTLDGQVKNANTVNLEGAFDLRIGPY